MKRFGAGLVFSLRVLLAWIVLAVCYFIFCLIAALDISIIKYIISLYSQLSPFLKLVVMVIGWSFFIGITVTPAVWASQLTIVLCDKIQPSRRGLRYIIMSILVILCCIFEAISGFMPRDIIIGLYGIIILIAGTGGLEGFEK